MCFFTPVLLIGRHIDRPVWSLHSFQLTIDLCLEHSDVTTIHRLVQLVLKGEQAIKNDTPPKREGRDFFKRENHMGIIILMDAMADSFKLITFNIL